MLAACLLAVALAPRVAGGEEETFAAGLAACEDVAHRGRPERALRSLLELLEEHDGDPDALLLLPVARERLARWAFDVSYDVPAPKEVVSGDLLSYSASSGKIKIRYRGGQLEDFGPQHGNLHPHPLEFDGEYSVELEWEERRVPDPAPILVVGNLSDVASGILLEGEVSLVESGGGYWNRIVAFSMESRVRIVREADSVTVHVDGRRVHERRFPATRFGGFGIAYAQLLPSAAELTIEGDARPGWIEGLVARREREAWLEFRAEHDADEGLPEWLARRARDADAPVRIAPPPGTEDGGAAWRAGLDAARPLATPWPDEASASRLRAFLEERGHELSVTERAALDALHELGSEGPADGATLSAALVEEHPGAASAHWVRALALERGGDRERALDEARRAFELFPASVDHATLLVRMQLDRADVDGARRTALDALANGIAPDHVADALVALDLAHRGPTWSKPFPRESEHWDVVTDVDARTAAIVADELEDAWRKVTAALERAPEERGTAWVLAGENAYLDLAGALRGVHAEPGRARSALDVDRLVAVHDAASPERTLVALRHTASHRMLDRVVDAWRVPAWLDEGLAEYVAAAARGLDAETIAGSGPETHVFVLGRDGFPDLAELMSRSRSALSESGWSGEAQAWSLVHFLLHSGEGERDILHALIEGLCDGLSADAATERALEGVAVPDLEARWHAHVLGLERLPVAR